MADTATDGTLDQTVTDQLNNPVTKELFDTIDDLRQLQVGEIVSLPQIIVVGDQSCGKSSVLEAITRLRFPARGDLCTRFATELILRRAEVPSVEVSIQFADDADDESANAREPFFRTGFDRDALPAIIEEAKERMGITDGSTTHFSKDILRVEVCGPQDYPLTLVDLPGYFHTATADQSQEGAQIVNELVSSYMSQTNTIILAVVSASNQLANQIVLQRAAQHDPKKERTMGVITKPDLLKPGSVNEKKFLQLVKGQEAAHKLGLGWHVLRNRSEGDEDTEPAERDAQEGSFFRTGAWSTVPPGQRGIESLRKRLSNFLLTHIKKSLPGLIGDIDRHLDEANVRLGRLGKERSSTEDIRSYLLGIADDFQRLARDAIDGKYSDPFFGALDENARKLRAKVRNLNRAFDSTLLTKGARHDIELDDLYNTNDPKPNDADAGPPFLRRFLELYDFPAPEPISEASLNAMIELMASDNQGKEFPGSANHEVVLQLFKMQSEPWKAIAERHLNLVSDYSKSFVEELFRELVGPDSQTTSSILHFCVDKYFDEKRELLALKLDELLRPYTSLFSMPLDREFRSRTSKRSLDKLTDQIYHLTLGGLGFGHSAEPRKWSRGEIRQSLVSRGEGTSTEFGTEKVIDMMLQYYDMSLRTFTENVVNLAVESCLVCDLPNILTPRKVDRMDEKKLRELGSESEDVQQERTQLKHQVDILRKGRDKCQRHRPRERTVLPRYKLEAPSTPAGRSSTVPRTPDLTRDSTPPANGAARAVTPRPLAISPRPAVVGSSPSSPSECSEPDEEPRQSGFGDFAGPSEWQGGMFGVPTEPQSSVGGKRREKVRQQ